MQPTILWAAEKMVLFLSLPARAALPTGLAEIDVAAGKR
jgi:hypothetical protein